MLSLQLYFPADQNCAYACLGSAAPASACPSAESHVASIALAVLALMCHVASLAANHATSPAAPRTAARVVMCLAANLIAHPVVRAAANQTAAHVTVRHAANQTAAHAATCHAANQIAAALDSPHAASSSAPQTAAPAPC